ncbi:alpha/beta hydrolase [Bacillus sp. B15-48]|uniref:alpha/beta fold hydrolase n=1 Tax=Bacillus sp. B15-48 TaxID=1548601 RepID=UPI00193EDEFA|nr:alpha/beta hydrolase [Bacillus sp. B15-48]MBM4761973.1 alpha/beta fold hydrolase [Bacillus sp. B15-48]
MPFCHLKYGNMYYDDYGTGTPIVMLHPPAMGRNVFHYQKPLQNHLRLILPDLGGHGDTKTNKAVFSTTDYVEEIRTLLDHLGIDKAVICGYSTGGNYAQEFALNYPDRTLALMLCGCFPEVQSYILKYEHIVGMYMVKHHPRLLARGIATAHTEDKQVRDLIYNHMIKTSQKTWFHCYHESVHYSCLDRLHELEMPVYLFYGSRDFTNKHIRFYKKRIPNVKTIIIKKVAHQIVTKKYLQFNQEVVKIINGLKIK